MDGTNAPHPREQVKANAGKFDRVKPPQTQIVSQTTPDSKIQDGENRMIGKIRKMKKNESKRKTTWFPSQGET